MKKRKVLKKVMALATAATMMMSSFTAMFVSAAETETVTYTAITDLAELSADDQYAIAIWRYFGGTDSDSTNGYLLHSGNDGSLRAATADDYATITYADGEIPDTALWKISGTAGLYTIQNVGTQKYLGASLSMDNEEGVAYTIVSGTSGGYQNFAIAYNNASIRYSGSSGSFSLGGGAPETAVTGTNACNATIYKVGTGTGEENPGGGDDDEPINPPNVHPNEALGPQIFFASDFQGTIAPTNLTKITNSMYNGGVTPELAVWCGDLVDGSVYEDGSDTSQAETAGQIKKIENTMKEKWPELDIKYLQGNHDYSGFITNGTMEKTGPIEYDDFIIYILNEDSFPWWQGVDSNYANSAENKKTVQATSDAMEAYFDKLIADGSEKPVIIAAHIPLAWSTRSTTGTTWWSDNVYGNILFEVINTAAKELDIVYLYGHNHSDGYDNYIGGSVNYVGVGDVMRVPNGTTGTENYTNEVINFTYANAGYIGAVSGNCTPSVSTASVMTIADDKIIVERYSTTGEYEDGAWEVARHQTGQPQMAISSTSKRETNPMVGEKEIFEVLVSDGLEVVSYEWSLANDNAVFESGADSAQVTLSYANSGDVNLTCKVTYKTADGVEDSMVEGIDITVDEVRLASVATVDTIYYNPSYNQNDKINDGLTNTFWCCWQASTVLQNPWASYTFDKDVELTGCVINWYDDGGGAQCPNGLTIEYQDSVGNWVPVTPTSDNYDVFVDGQDNTYTFEKVVTKAIRLVMDNSVSNASVAIREWNLIGGFYDGEVGCDVISSIYVTPPTKTEYQVGEELDLAGASVLIKYCDGSDGYVDITECEITGFDSSKAGKLTLYVTYEGKVDDFEVTIVEAEPDPTPTPTPDPDPTPTPGPDPTPTPDPDPTPTPDPDPTPTPDPDPTPDPTPTPGDPLPYEDVTEDDWFYKSVAYTYYENVMTGMDKTHFGPYGQLSRAQFALILYRIEGEPKVETEKTFGDITGDEWYGQAVLWAAEEGIVGGYMDGNFGPADNITREQMALMMFRYAKYLEQDTSASVDYSEFLDAASVSEFAADAMKWVVAEGIITGKDGGTKLDPQGNTARCEAAAIIQRFME